ncbi:hypothetical protein N9I83_00060 [bacterium]|nr:hypothetical protein [bacterium]
MPISKTGGISISEINSFLSKGNDISDYYNEHYLNTASNRATIFNQDRPISFGAFDNLDKLPDEPAITPFVNLLKQGGDGNFFKGDGNFTLSVVFDAVENPLSQPVLPYPASQRPDLTEAKWYETTGGAFTEIAATSTTKRSVRGRIGTFFEPEFDSPRFRFTSVLTLPKSAIGTRTFVARAEVFTINQKTNEVVASEVTTFNEYTVVISQADEPVITAQTQVGGQDVSGTIISYTDGSATSYPSLGVAFNYTFAEGSSPGWTKTARAESHQSYVSFNNGAWVASTAGGVGPYGPFHRSHDPTKPAELFGYWVRSPIKFVVAGEWRHKLVSSLSVTFTKPDGTTGYVITATDESITTTTIGSKTVDNAVPTLLGWSIAEDSVSEDGGVVTATLSTQHAIGEDITLAASENFGSNLNIWKKQKITANSMTFKFTSKARNHGDNRTLTLYATPEGTWTDTARVSDTVTLTNSGAPTLLDGYGINVGSVDEGGSFTYTLKGVNFAEEDYTWTTTFPAASVSATSGSFSTPYAGNYYTGNYHGTFTVDTVARTDHYEDVTGGQIKVYKNGTLYTQTGATLKIKNTTAQPVTLPVIAYAPAPLAHAKINKRTSNWETWQGSASVSITLNNDSTWSSSTGVKGTYATPAPLEGDWVPNITSAGPIAKTVTHEDIVWGIVPSGGFAYTTSISGSTVKLNVRGVKAQSLTGQASCTFFFNFKNTVSGATRGVGLINLSLTVNAVPVKPIYFDPGIGGESGIYHEEIVDPIIVTESPPAKVHPTRGGLIRTKCLGTTQYGDYHNGTGGEYQAVIKFLSTECGWTSPINDSPKVEPEIHEPSIDVTTQSYAAGGSVRDEVNQNIYNQNLAEIDEKIRQNINVTAIPDYSNVLKDIKLDISKIRIDISNINIGSF